MIESYAKREKLFLSLKTTLAQKLRQFILLSQVWYNRVVVISKKNICFALPYYQVTDHALHLNMNQNFDDSSGGRTLVKEIEVPNDVADILESWLNKDKEAGDVMNNITIVEPSNGTDGPTKIMISSDSIYYKSNEGNLN